MLLRPAMGPVPCLASATQDWQDCQDSWLSQDMGPVPWQALKAFHGNFFDFNHVFLHWVNFWKVPQEI